MPARTPVDALGALAVLGEPTRRRLYEYVASSGTPVGRDEAAAELGITRALAAFHLDRLSREGLLTYEYRRISGRAGRGAGRPAKLYRRAAVEIDASLPPRRYAFAAELMAEALTGRRATAARKALLEAGRDAGRAAAAAAGKASLEGAGFEPSVQPDGTVVLRNCPYAALVPEHRDVICAMNLAYAEGFLEGVGAAGGSSLGVEPRTKGAKQSSLVARLEPAEGRCCVLLVPSPGLEAQPSA